MYLNDVHVLMLIDFADQLNPNFEMSILLEQETLGYDVWEGQDGAGVQDLVFLEVDRNNGAGEAELVCFRAENFNLGGELGRLLRRADDVDPDVEEARLVIFLLGHKEHSVLKVHPLRLPVEVGQVLVSKAVLLHSEAQIGGSFEGLGGDAVFRQVLDEPSHRKKVPAFQVRTPDFS